MKFYENKLSKNTYQQWLYHNRRTTVVHRNIKKIGKLEPRE